MKNVISYSLWGDDLKYWAGAKKNVELARRHFPGWISRFYVQDDLTNKGNKLLDEFHAASIGADVEICHVHSKGRFHGMFWRFWAAGDEDTNLMLCRDTDSRLSQREAAAVSEWLASDKDFHIIRDHPYHTMEIMGGTWGCRNGILRNIDIKQKIEEWPNYKTKGCDQEFLAAVVYPRVSMYSYEHSSFGVRFNNDVHEIKAGRIDLEFIGDVFDENDKRNAEFRERLAQALGTTSR